MAKAKEFYEDCLNNVNKLLAHFSSFIYSLTYFIDKNIKSKDHESEINRILNTMDVSCGSNFYSELY